MIVAFRQANVKALETLAEQFTAEEDLLSLYAWQNFLRFVHRGNPDPGYLVTELKLPFEVTWSILIQANTRIDDHNKTITANLIKAVEKYVTHI